MTLAVAVTGPEPFASLSCEVCNSPIGSSGVILPGDNAAGTPDIAFCSPEHARSRGWPSLRSLDLEPARKDDPLRNRKSSKPLTEVETVVDDDAADQPSSELSADDAAAAAWSPLPLDRDPEGEVATDMAIATGADLAEATLTGDLRDFILDRLKHQQSLRPWHERSEGEQRETVHQVEVAVRAAVRSAIEIIAGGDQRSIKATVEQITVKDGIKATLSMSKHDENRFGLIDAQGKTVLIIVADPDDFTGERQPVAISPDQAELIGDTAMVQHSGVTSETPFH